VRRVAVIVDLDDRTIAGIVAGLAPDLLQLHGRETPERANELRARFGVGIIKVSSVATPADIDAATRYESVVDMLMFDAKPPPRPDALPGGNATRFDWSLLAGRGFARPWILSGGLDPANVGDAIRATNPTAVDVSSGVESRPGVKNPERIRAFLAAIRDTAAQA
jgi:phosphoribosylanthranilate isomerase